MPKVCSHCGLGKPATLKFFAPKRGALTARCRDCLRAEDRRRNRENPQRRLKRQTNPERCRANDAAYYQRNAERIKRQAREWGDNNKARKAENLRNWHRKQRVESSEYRLRKSISALIYWHLKCGKGGKRTEEVLGYSIAALKLHIERQFKPRMSWDNYGEWHIDHIVPVASFNFNGAEDPQFRACWALSNLRPLWALDNIAKSDRRDFLI